MDHVNEAKEAASRSTWMCFILLVISATALLIYCSYPGLFIPFDSDDLMNLHEGWMIPLPTVLAEVANPFTLLYRPTTALYYRAIYGLVGWDPFSFRVAAYALMSINIAIVAALAVVLSERRAVTAATVCGVLLYSFHPRLWQYYRSNGTVYDLICFSLAGFGLLSYIAGAQSRPSWWRIFYCLVLPPLLLLLAFNAKEMAAAFPLLIICYAAIYRVERKLLLSSLAVYCILFSIMAASKVRPVGPLHDNPAYKLDISAGRALDNANRLLADLVRADESLTSIRSGILIASLLACAFLVRSRKFMFALVFILLTPFPILFIPYRGFFVMYIPWAGWALAFVAAAEKLLLATRSLSYSKAARVLEYGSPIVVGLVVVSGQRDLKYLNSHVDALSRVIEATKNDFLRLDEPLPKGAWILLERSRFPDDAWGPLMIARLLYNDRNLALDRPTMMAKPPTPQDYDRVIEFDGRKFIIVRRKAGERRTGYLPSTHGSWPEI